MVELYRCKENCCACTACMSICPKQAITMKPDEDGFLYPVVDESLCLECGLCKKVCVFQKDIKNYNISKEPLATYAAVLKNRVLLKNSASGGAFVALALYILNNKGVVFGCSMDKNMQPKHICIDNISDIKKLQGSKYVQSDLKNTFIEAERYLQENRHVIFTGTPCQISGLKSYLGKDYDNLITVDLICHGVPSPLFFKGYVNWLENKLNGSVTDLIFRDKINGWGLTSKVIYKKGNKKNEKIFYPIESYYYQYFLKGYIYRESCYKCPYANSNRPGDFTIGDYWGIEEVHPEIDTSNGVSLILINSKKGLRLVGTMDEFDKDGDSDKISNDIKLNNYMYLTRSSFNKAKMYNEQLNAPVFNSDERDIILTIFREEGFQGVANKYYSEMKNEIMIWKLKSLIPKPLKNTIKKVLYKIGYYR